jgi:hypothetical protein
MEVLKGFIRFESDLILGTELHGFGCRTAGKWKRYWHETENWCFVKNSNKKTERKEEEEGNKERKKEKTNGRTNNG